MDAKETSKSIFVYPDKLYARTNDNITLDISYAPQTLDAVEYSRTDAFIKKAEKYIRNVADGLDRDDDVEAFISGFRKYMKGE